MLCRGYSGHITPLNVDIEVPILDKVNVEESQGGCMRGVQRVTVIVPFKMLNKILKRC